MVINFDLPVQYGRYSEPDNEVYLHRVGRAGRFGRKGISLLIMHIVFLIWQYFGLKHDFDWIKLVFCAGQVLCSTCFVLTAMI